MKGFIFFTEVIILSLGLFFFLNTLVSAKQSFLEDKYYVASDILFLTDLNEVLLTKDDVLIKNYLDIFEKDYSFLANYYSSDFNNFLNISIGNEPNSYIQNKRVVYDKDNEEYIIMTIKLKVIT